MSRARVLDKVTKLLVGTEKLSPKALSTVRNYVTSTGRINPAALGDRRLLGDLLIGKKGAMEVLKARYAQGGIIGPGGLIRGELALDPRYTKLFKAYTQSPKGAAVLDPYTGKAISKARATGKLLTRGLGESLNPLFVLGFPAMDIMSAARTPESDPHGGMSGMLGALGSGLGFAAAGPLGIVGGMGAGMVGERIGSSIGSLFDSKKPPSIQGANSLSPKLSALAPNLILDAAIPT